MSIEAGPLPAGLQDLQRQTGIELLFDPGLVSGLEAPAVEGDLTTEAALRGLLAETGLTLRRASSGAWIIGRADAAPLEQQDAAAPEIIVIGRRSQNAGLRRSENDVQPYVIVTQDDIRSAHRDNIDQIFQSRVTANTTAVPPSLSGGADTRSEIDLRGLGSENTLVLVDGRRMPRAPFSLSFAQGDLNAIPLHAIERIEVLTGAAGGIHGFGTLGGAVNVVIDREHRGFDLYVTEGISSRGDARSEAIEASFGYTSPSGATHFTIFASHSELDALYVSDRDFEARDRQRTYEIAPDAYLEPLFNLRHGNSITVVSSFGNDLVFKPEFGGAPLGSSFTFLPVGYSGDPLALADALEANAGQVDLSVPERNQHSDLTANPRSNALLVNFRHQFRPGLEIFADAALLRSRGRAHEYGQSATLFLDPDSPINPFTDYIDVSFPVDQGDAEIRKRVESNRYTVGVLADLPFDWRAAAEASWGGFRYRASSSNTYSIAAIAYDGDPSPFGNWDALQAALATDLVRNTAYNDVDTEFQVQAARFAGPVFNLGAGPATLTLLAEHRREEAPPYTYHQTQYYNGAVTSSDLSFGGTSTEVTSFYGELRAPVFDNNAFLPLFRGMELQLAVRRDEQESVFPHDGQDSSSEPISVTFIETAYTAGFKTSPMPWLMLRGSYATGEQPPDLNALRTIDDSEISIGVVDDPKRGGFSLFGPFTLRSGGSPDLDLVRAETISLGAILTPFGEDGARVAIDFSRIRRAGDVIGFLDLDLILAHEDYWPERIERGPLTEDDIALGYTGGAITMIDARFMNGGSLEVETIDLRAEWPLTLFGGRLRLYADATYQMRNVVQRLFRSDFERTEYFQGPLIWRANGGFSWSRDDVTIGANIQYFDDYPLLERSAFIDFDDDTTSQYQGSQRVESQTYLDLYGSWRLPLQGRDITIDLGIINALDARPPRETRFRFLSEQGVSFSRYGDPRRRRFELVVRTHF